MEIFSVFKRALFSAYVGGVRFYSFKCYSFIFKLLVLETLQQHLQYHVCPAQSRQVLYREYMRLVRHEDEQKGNNLSQLINKWEDKCQWYDEDPYNTTRLGSISRDEQQGGLFSFSSSNSVPSQSTSIFGAPIMTSTTAGFSFGAPSATSNQTGFTFGGTTATSNSAGPAFAAVPSTSSSGLFGASVSSSTAVSDQSSLTTEATSNIILTEYNPHLPYTARIASATNAISAYLIYLSERTLYRQSPSFYFDIASYFFSANSFSSSIDQFNQKGGQTTQIIDKKSMEYGLRILTNILELEMEAPQLYRTVAYKCMELKQWNLALSIFRKIYLLRSDEPQSLRDLALVLIEIGQYEQALEYFKQILTQKWDIRFDTILPVVLSDFNRLLTLMKKIPSDIDHRLVRHLPVDIRIVVEWDTPDTNVQLVVSEPNNPLQHNLHTFEIE